jgi:hypothetical protein
MHPAVAVGLALSAALLSSCGGSSSPADDRGGRPGTGAQASCVAAVVYDGNTYHGRGRLQQNPDTTGEVVDGSIPGCNDTGGDAEPAEDVQLEELSDVPLETAVLFHGSVYVRDGHQLPASTQAWFEVPECSEAGEFELTGDWLGVGSDKKVRFDGDIRLPYTVEMHVTDGPQQYVGATINVHAFESTSPALGPADVKNSLWEGGQVHAHIDCNEGRYEALALDVPDA